jgi:PKD repeat protein
MKLNIIFKILVLTTVTIQVFSQNSLLSVTGHVFDETTGFPIPNHVVTVNVTGNGFVDTYDFFSNPEGLWGSDSLMGYSLGSVNAMTLDCFGQLHEFQENYTPDITTFTFDFFICSDSSQVNDCENLFEFITNDNWNFQFSGEVIPLSPAEFFWDFGDGTIATGQQVTHEYIPSGISSYMVCLTTISTGLSGDTCTAISCEEVYVGTQPGDCINWFTYQPPNGTTVEFHGESLPEPAIIFSWNFGDGLTGIGQNIVHNFNPSMGNEFLVQLTTFSYNPATGDSCIAFSEQLVSLPIIPNCDANFFYVAEPTIPFTVNFFDNSTGIISSRSWDFGDGATSEEINPVHTYSESGDYYVCLTISGDSLGNYCTDTYCAYISIQEQLQAAFNFFLDTLSGAIRQYYFTDASAGNPETWQWTFGDEYFSNEQNPVHQFDYSGMFNVCIQVTKTLPNGGIVSDDYCYEIEVPSYYDLGGLVFTGLNPINNPYPTGDTGIAYLYRIYNNNIIPVDTNYFYAFGYYWFTGVREGNHIVKAGLTENSENFGSFAQAYYPQQLYWDDAETIQVLDSNNYYVDVHLIGLQGIESGIGSINGHIIDLPNPSLSDYVYGQPVYLYSESDELLASVLSNFMGSFSFNNLAYGAYKLRTDVTGFYCEPIMVTLDQANPVYNNVLLEIFETYPNGSVEIEHTDFISGPVYPNPVMDKLNIDLKNHRDLEIHVSVYALTGIKVLEETIRIGAGNNTITLSTQGLGGGLYFVRLAVEGEEKEISCKFLRN